MVTQGDTYTAPGTGASVQINTGTGAYGIQVKGTGAAATSWIVLLEGSLDGQNWMTILTHNSVDGSIVWSAANLSPVLFFRSHCTALVLGLATNIVVTIGAA